MRRLVSFRWQFATIVGLLLGVGVGSLVDDAAHAQQAANLMFAVTENRVPGAAGTGTITALPNNQIRVDIRLTGLPPSGERAAHIHTASGARCDTNAPVTYPLNNVSVDAAGVGTSSTTLTLTADKPVEANNAYVNVHQAVTPAGPGVICANVTTGFTAGAQGAPSGAQPQAGAQPAAPKTPSGMPSALPNTGTGGPRNEPHTGGWTVAGFAMLVVLLGGLGVVAVVRRR